jgi:hypothetical protein
LAVKKTTTEKKAAAKKARKVNREGQRWTEDRPGMTLRLPIDLREAVTEESRVKGDLAKIVLFALAHVDKKEVEITQTRKAGLRSPILSSSTSGRRRDWRSRRGLKKKASASMQLSGVFWKSFSSA